MAKIYRVEAVMKQAWFIDIEARDEQDAKDIAQKALDADDGATLPLFTEPYYAEGFEIRSAEEIDENEKRNGMDEVNEVLENADDNE